MGPVICNRQLDRMERIIRERTSGTVLAGGERMLGRSPLDDHDLSRGLFFAPTVIADVSPDGELWKEEVFGPVVAISRFNVSSKWSDDEPDVTSHTTKSENEGISLANECRYGLGAGIWTSDLSRAHRVAANIEAGLVWVNTHHRNDPSSPW